MEITLSNGVIVKVDPSYADMTPAQQEAAKQYILEQWQANQSKAQSEGAPSKGEGQQSAFVPGAVGALGGVTFGGELHRKAMEKFPVKPSTAANVPAGKPSVTTQFISPEQVQERIMQSGTAPNVREKVAGAGQPSNWTRTALGETHELPEKFLQQVTSMKGSGVEGGGQTLIDKDLKNLEKIKDIGAGDYKLSGAADKQLMLPEEVAAERQAALEKRAATAAETRANRLGALEQARLAEQAKLEAAAKQPMNQLKNLGQKTLGAAGESLSNITKPFATNMFTKGLTGFAAGYGGYDALQRFKRDEYLRGVLSLLGAGGDIATMSRHPAAMVPGMIVGTGAPMLNTYLDKLAEEGKLPKGFADGGVVNLNASAINPLAPQPINPNLTRGPNVVLNRLPSPMMANTAIGETDPQTAPGLQALIGYPR